VLGQQKREKHISGLKEHEEKLNGKVKIPQHLYYQSLSTRQQPYQLFLPVPEQSLVEKQPGMVPGS
jgi:hypothetical protein